MWNKRKTLVTGALALILAAALAGCGGSAEPAAEQAEESATSAGEAELTSYTGEQGWTVRYDPALIQVEEGDDGVSFLYQGDGRSKASIRWVADQQPEETLYEVVSPWTDDDLAIARSEGIFPGTDDKWGFWRVLEAPEDNTEPARTAIAGEYNGGVLLLEEEAWLTGDDSADYAAAGALETIVDSITYERFDPQTMYDYVPGTYNAVQDGAAYEVAGSDGETIELSPGDAVGAVILNEDHTGVLRMQDDVDILWGSTELMAADGSFTYEYTVEGDSLMVNYDGQ